MARFARTTVAPSAARLTESLRDIGYDFQSAVADLVDNSVTAGASRVDVVIEYDGAASRVLIADDGGGMNANGLLEALRFGSRRDYGPGDLGRYGLGLKTASLSQCRSVTAVSRRQGAVGVVSRQLDLDLIREMDDWLVVDPGAVPGVRWAREWLGEGNGTVVVWNKLDRVLPESGPEGGWARRRFDSLRRRTVEHLALVFHRYLGDDAAEGHRVVLSVNGEKVTAWDPYARSEGATRELPEQSFELVVGDVQGTVTLRRFVLPSRDAFSSAEEFERLSGPRKWNRQQGLYVYRANRLVQWGGWAGLRAIDEHTKLARCQLDFDTALDPIFNINVAKMRVALPAELRQMLERPVHEVCVFADSAYRKSARGGAADTPSPKPSSTVLDRRAGLALTSAAIQSDNFDALNAIVDVLRKQAPEVVEALGL